MIPGRATPDGTAAYAARHAAAAGHFRIAQTLSLSSVGLGSYLGNLDAQARRGYAEATHTALSSGLNVLDTAANYRDQVSERDLGRGLRHYVADGGDREGVVVATKAGFLHGDADEGETDGWFESEYLHSGVLHKDDVVSGHSLAPAYITHEIDRSRRNLGVDTLDIAFLHNVEHPLQEGVAEADFYQRVEDAFEVLERACDDGHVARYGVATWNGLRVPPGTPGHLSLVKLVHHAGAARMRAGGNAATHHFRALELPVNPMMTEAYLHPTQPFRFGDQTVLHAAREMDMIVFASASLVQMRAAGRMPAAYADALGTQDYARTALQFTRSVPGVTTALVGTGRPEHAASNAAFAKGTSPAPGIVKTLLGTGSIHGW